MKITICSSMAFAEEMVEIKKELIKKEHEIVLPEGFKNYLENSKLRKKALKWGDKEGTKMKIDNDLIKKHYQEIKNSDAILVINKKKKGIKNYIGGNVFLEMGFAYVLDKKIFTLNPLTKKPKIYYQELLAINPIILNGDLDKIN
jgi:hypothetical protein